MTYWTSNLFTVYVFRQLCLTMSVWVRANGSFTTAMTILAIYYSTLAPNYHFLTLLPLNPNFHIIIFQPIEISRTLEECDAILDLMCYWYTKRLVGMVKMQV